MQKKEESAKGKGAYAKTPKLPVFQQDKDDMDSYLGRFERYAKAQRWDGSMWAINLSALLTGKALEVYYRLASSEMDDYDVLKEALLKNFQLTESGFHDKWFSGKALSGETASQLMTRLEGYFDRWITLAKIAESYEGCCL